ncbi:hypothetical protein HUJ04_011091, partial [Dendroctonus ponderosae]
IRDSKIINPANCEVRSVIRLLCAKGSSAAEIDRELCLAYGPKVMSGGKVRQCCRDFKNGRANVHDEERSGIQTDEIVSKSHQAASFYAEGLNKLVQRYEKSLEVNGDYVEK